MTATENKTAAVRERRFDFSSDTFAFANELQWEYQLDPTTGQMTFRKREPKPTYSLRCFVLVRTARQFFYHARFEPAQATVSDAAYRKRVAQIVARNPRTPCPPDQQIIIPGYATLRQFSTARAQLLKETCGGAWRSYVLRSHWRMVLPISREHQEHTATSLTAAVGQGRSPIVHLVKFPALTINHGMIVYAASATSKKIKFECYDPNNPQAPVELSFDRGTGMFSLPANSYWAGGELKIIEIYRSWLM